ncbi:hypothetical protein [Deinococcus aerophilus]|uniref:Uncharacterized protein n=1 Tax=Deinococcus aerophilus TaxID=522488 RepID=A0ABQ2GXE8_9DEIO|nr:hypothetical protein [Deinococcus aerophilus]GGM16853.1 hypothetical protein GCM10010841_26450 [Deinococcus aerophilus]
MTRGGSTWRRYVALLEAVAAHYGTDHTVGDGDDALLTRFLADVDRGNAAAAAVMNALGSGTYVRRHLRYIAAWGPERRALLAAGANFQLLETLGQQDRTGRLRGLSLTGSLSDQRRQLAGHLRREQDPPPGRGWLAPRPPGGRPPRRYDHRDLAWVYRREEVDHAEGLHPAVARSLIARYQPTPGVVADPMAGAGNVARIATELGHIAWASDRWPPPGARHVRPLNLLVSDLGTALQDSPHPHPHLLILHPPLPGSLNLPRDRFTPDDAGYVAWLERILEHSVPAVKAGGHVALIVPLGVPHELLGTVRSALQRSLRHAFAQDGDDPAPLRWTRNARGAVEELGTLHTHLCVARDGREGWHLLVARIPPLPDEEAPA